jgi:hypothetical protein
VYYQHVYSEFMMVVPTWSLADMHAKETDTINTLRTHLKTRENAFSWRESGDKHLTECDNNQPGTLILYCIFTRGGRIILAIVKKTLHKL